MMAMDYRAAKARKMVGEAPLGLSPMQSFPSHIILFLSNCFKDSSLFEMGNGLPLSKWSAKGLARFHSIDLDVLLAVDFVTSMRLIEYCIFCIQWLVLAYLRPSGWVESPSSPITTVSGV